MHLDIHLFQNLIGHFFFRLLSFSSHWFLSSLLQILDKWILCPFLLHAFWGKLNVVGNVQHLDFIQVECFGFKMHEH